MSFKRQCIMLKLKGWIHPYNIFSPCCDFKGSDSNPCIDPTIILSFVPPLANINHIWSTCHMLWIFECHGSKNQRDVKLCIKTHEEGYLQHHRLLFFASCLCSSFILFITTFWCVNFSISFFLTKRTNQIIEHYVPLCDKH